jgi:hypothetical protein
LSINSRKTARELPGVCFINALILFRSSTYMT